MSIRMIQERLRSYSCSSEQEEDHAVREITQEVILASLSRAGFFADAVFQGGTCLRIFHALNRFSEDLDFVLREPNPRFRLTPFLQNVATELNAYGYQAEISDRSSTDHAVRKAFIKDDSLGHLLQFSYLGRSGPVRKIRIKVEVDVNPPAGSRSELRYTEFPFLASVTLQDVPSLFAGKLHALLCREYAKGRDWYDFLWYTARKSAVNFEFLASALRQSGPWQDQDLQVDARWVRTALEATIQRLDWRAAATDVQRFLPSSEHPSLPLWSAELFLSRLDRIR